jgi:hypothetical protein
MPCAARRGVSHPRAPVIIDQALLSTQAGGGSPPANRRGGPGELRTVKVEKCGGCQRAIPNLLACKVSVALASLL